MGYLILAPHVLPALVGILRDVGTLGLQCHLEKTLVFDCTDTIVGHLTDLMAQWMEEVDKMLESHQVCPGLVLWPPKQCYGRVAGRTWWMLLTSQLMGTLHRNPEWRGDRWKRHCYGVSMV